MSHPYQTPHKESFPSREEKVLEFWKKQDIFKKSLEIRKKSPLFSFYDGPPFATGLPHYGHLLTSTIKDSVQRYKTMQGYLVPRRFGWDCHGLPIENEIEKAQGLSGSLAIEEFGIARFNEECRNIVLRYTKEWKSTINRMGRFVDFDEMYTTMDTTFMESVWWVFSQLYAKGLVYEGFKVMPFSAKLGTPLSNFEANLNYQDVDDPSLTVSFLLDSDPSTALLVWTTTPWTLPSNLAIAVGPDITYVKIKCKDDPLFYILAKERLPAYFKNLEEVEIIEILQGKQLAGKKYLPLFPYFTQQQQAFKVLSDPFVSTEDGTGIVHMAPAFGEMDFYLCTAAGIELVCPIDSNGKFTKEVPELAGLFVKDADKEILKMLKEKQRVFRIGQIRHRYPFCWRSDTPLIYRAMRTWFIAVEKIKDNLLKNNEEIHWVPSHIQHGRFGKWLENARDWAVSRNRYWGTPIPIWRAADGEIIVIGSIAELEKRTDQKIEDLHRHLIDNLTFTENGKVFHRIPEVFDCWFESGAMPYAQNHYPFENVELTKKNFPADFIAEGLDQTRGWFYTLHILATALFDQPAFKNVIVNGIILAEDGNKMSKRLKNYPDPEKVLNEYGADAIRLFLLNSTAVYGEDLRFVEKGVEQIMRLVLIPFWNSYIFFATYANIYNWRPTEDLPITTSIDCWILSCLQKLVEEVTFAMDRYELNLAIQPFIDFINALTNWYIRRCRSRFWAAEDTLDRKQAFHTLYTVVKTLCQVAAPFIPFLSEQIYLQLRTEKDPESVHLTNFPLPNPSLRNPALEKQMAVIQLIVSNGHALRKEHKLKVRQPLQEACIIAADEDLLLSLKHEEKLIAEELNVHRITYSCHEEEFVKLTCKPNFRVLGKKVGSKMKSTQAIIEMFTQKQMAILLSGLNLDIEVEGEVFTLSAEDVAVERQVKEGLIARSETGITILLNLHLTQELLEEGIARELINKINTMRRDMGFYVTDRISIVIEASPHVQKVFQQYQSYIASEVLAVHVSFAPCEGTEWDINGEKAVLAISLAEKT